MGPTRLLWPSLVVLVLSTAARTVCLQVFLQLQESILQLDEKDPFLVTLCVLLGHAVAWPLYQAIRRLKRAWRNKHTSIPSTLDPALSLANEATPPPQVQTAGLSPVVATTTSRGRSWEEAAEERKSKTAASSSPPPPSLASGTASTPPHSSRSRQSRSSSAENSSANVKSLPARLPSASSPSPWSQRPTTPSTALVATTTNHNGSSSPIFRLRTGASLPSAPASPASQTSSSSSPHRGTPDGNAAAVVVIASERRSPTTAAPPPLLPRRLGSKRSSPTNSLGQSLPSRGGSTTSSRKSSSSKAAAGAATTTSSGQSSVLSNTLSSLVPREKRTGNSDAKSFKSHASLQSVTSSTKLSSVPEVTHGGVGGADEANNVNHTLDPSSHSDAAIHGSLPSSPQRRRQKASLSQTFRSAVGTWPVLEPRPVEKPQNRFDFVAEIDVEQEDVDSQQQERLLFAQQVQVLQRERALQDGEAVPPAEPPLRRHSTSAPGPYEEWLPYTSNPSGLSLRFSPDSKQDDVSTLASFPTPEESQVSAPSWEAQLAAMAASKEWEAPFQLPISLATKSETTSLHDAESVLATLSPSTGVPNPAWPAMETKSSQRRKRRAPRAKSSPPVSYNSKMPSPYHPHKSKASSSSSSIRAKHELRKQQEEDLAAREKRVVQLLKKVNDGHVKLASPQASHDSQDDPSLRPPSLVNLSSPLSAGTWSSFHSAGSQWVQRLPDGVQPLIPALLALTKIILRVAALLYLSASVTEFLITGLELLLWLTTGPPDSTMHQRSGGVAVVGVGLTQIATIAFLSHQHWGGLGIESDKVQDDGASIPDFWLGFAFTLGFVFLDRLHRFSEEFALQMTSFSPSKLLGLQGLYGLVITIPLYFGMGYALGWNPAETFQHASESAALVVMTWVVILVAALAGMSESIHRGAPASRLHGAGMSLRCLVVLALATTIYYATDSPNLDDGDDFGEPFLVPECWLYLGAFGVMLTGLRVHTVFTSSTEPSLAD